MFFNPHSQIQDEPATRQQGPIFIPQNFPLFQNPAPSSPVRARSMSLFPSAKQEDWIFSGPTETTNAGSLGNLDADNTSITYDIYGNELPSRDEFPQWVEPKDMDLESIAEEEIMSPDAVAINQENKDPVLKMMTPLKNRTPAGRVTERRNSFALNRSPLLDITPPVSRRKCSYNVESKFERALMGNSTGTSKNEIKDDFLTRRLR